MKENSQQQTPGARISIVKGGEEVPLSEVGSPTDEILVVQGGKKVPLSKVDQERVLTPAGAGEIQQADVSGHDKRVKVDNSGPVAVAKTQVLTLRD